MITSFQIPDETKALLKQPGGACGKNDLIYDGTGESFIDLSMGHGSVFMGHANQEIASHVHRQVDSLWTRSEISLEIVHKAAQAAEKLLTKDYKLAQFYSTGMEAVETALRIAQVTTQKTRVGGLQESAHGKSFAAIGLGWENRFNKNNIFFRLPFPSGDKSEKSLAVLDKELKAGNIAAVVVEPVLCSKSGKLLSPDFFRELSMRCRRHGCFLIVDEVITGCYRTGPAFLSVELGFEPDILIAGKALGNGFPVSAVFLNKKHSSNPEMYLNSTYSNNPLAAAAVYGTLSEMKKLNFNEIALRVETVLKEELAGMEKFGIYLEGKGCLWILEFPENYPVEKLTAELFKNGVLLSATSSIIRLLPPATILPDNLRKACRLIKNTASRHTPA